MSENKRYSPSWLNRLTNGLDSLPVPAWVVYFVAIVVLGYSLNWWEWQTQVRPTGVFDLERSTDGLWPIFFIAFFHYLNKTAKKALAKFKPLLDITEEDYAFLELKISVFPALPGWLILIGSALLSIPALVSGLETGPFLGGVFIYLFSTLVFSALIIQISQTFRQIRLIMQLQRSVKKISLFHLGPTHAFAELTSKMGMGLIFIVVFGVIQLAYMGTPMEFAFINIVLLLIAVFAFVSPIWGMRVKLLEERAFLLDKMDYQIERLFNQFNQASNDGELENIQTYSKALQAQRAERAALNQVSMWPWETRTLRGFASTFLVPILLWSITRLLGSLF